MLLDVTRYLVPFFWLLMAILVLGVAAIATAALRHRRRGSDASPPQVRVEVRAQRGKHARSA
jgi:hypothetical protein